MTVMKALSLNITEALYVLCLLVCSLFLAACTAEQPSHAEMSLSTDKGLYHSGETVNISVQVNSTLGFNGTMSVYGIFSGINRLNLKRDVLVSPGENDFFFQYQAPACNKCSGIPEGIYNITAELQGDIPLNSKVSIDIRQ
ncbi:hypothetical protein JW968_03475 [Candidatus Woesearchaeota archaeon]|nr:hypothetical protein [Candidatus Woesearchaeota archaeon]